MAFLEQYFASCLYYISYLNFDTYLGHTVKSFSLQELTLLSCNHVVTSLELLYIKKTIEVEIMRVIFPWF